MFLQGVVKTLEVVRLEVRQIPGYRRLLILRILILTHLIILQRVLHCVVRKG